MRIWPDNGDARRRVLAGAEERYRTAPFTLYELGLDPPEPFIIGDGLWEDGETVSLGVAYGNPLRTPTGQLAQVVTSRPGHQPNPVGLLESEHRDRGLGPIDSLNRDTTTVLLDGQSVEAGKIRSKEAWVAQLDVEDLNVTVIGVRWEPDQISIRPVTDIEAYLQGWRELLGDWAT